ncbi:hypothetical protein PB01_03390 [Psychrobacillus glaciei]|uniref:AtpZ/AtpI family protein n=1 Tax=Psychrobacillus glaciei TaxID=2283160 RepID=A0A5J6SU74_9BACI|nr:AtpZ/AtpI family protein [Psychrobacillus glaciei]QFG01084.1 hypothetical protein PB01_03390 [Psychrobacillus glaciei]
MQCIFANLSQFIGSNLIGIFTGMWIDDIYRTTPLFLVISMLVDLMVGMFAIITTIRKYDSGD